MNFEIDVIKAKSDHEMHLLLPHSEPNRPQLSVHRPLEEVEKALEFPVIEKCD